MKSSRNKIYEIENSINNVGKGIDLDIFYKENKNKGKLNYKISSFDLSETSDKDYLKGNQNLINGKISEYLKNDTFINKGQHFNNDISLRDQKIITKFNNKRKNISNDVDEIKTEKKKNCEENTLENNNSGKEIVNSNSKNIIEPSFLAFENSYKNKDEIDIDKRFIERKKNDDPEIDNEENIPD